MRLRFAGALSLAVVLSLSQIPAGAQAGRAGASASPAPRHSSRPRRQARSVGNLAGVMSAANDDILSAFRQQGRSRRPGDCRRRRDSLPTRGAQQEAGELRQSRRRETPRRTVTCRACPRITYMPFPFQIIQLPESDHDSVPRYVHATRYIYTNGSPHPPGPIEWWMGDSRGRWEGDTLVVDVVHFNDATWFDRTGNFSQRRAARRGALFAGRPRSHQLRSHDRGSEGLHASVEDAHGALSPHRTQLPAA